ncbi:MAG TPA: type III-A CRISPR-associated protein Csm2 [Candidatus Hydrogenedens sp.]|nr:type III-A CRISPR-associated protein Csm2 [Candidatus Hydrogenedens sp.]HOL20850.1 type III-A CRISPR-associated protein Csm2 [Candidatus Hydrogenedens sp.]
MYQDRNRGWNQERNQHSPIPEPNPNFFAKMVRDGITPEFIKDAENCGDYLANKVHLTTTQIRRIFGHIKKIENFEDPKRFIPQLLMLKPMLAYTAKRNKEVDKLKEITDKAIDVVTDKEIQNDKEKQLVRFRLFCKGFEAILAYHKAKGGKD